MTYWGDSLVYRQIQWVSTPKSARLFGSALNDRFCKQHSCKSCNGISWKWRIVESILFLPSYYLTRSTMNQPRLHQNRNRAFYDETLAIVHHHKRQQRTVQWPDHQSNICFNRPHSRRILKKYNVGLPVSSLTSTWIPPLRMCNGIIGQIRVRFSSAEENITLSISLLQIRPHLVDINLDISTPSLRGHQHVKNSAQISASNLNEILLFWILSMLTVLEKLLDLIMLNNFMCFLS